VRRASFLCVLLAACGNGEPEPAPDTHGSEPAAPQGTSAVPDHVVYEEILIAFQGSFAKVETDRPREAARDLAHRVFDMARLGGDFDVLKEEYTDLRPEGAPSGPTRVARDGVECATNEIYRSTLFAGVSAVLYGLKVGEVGLVEYDPKRCPIGWLLIKRTR